LSVDVTEVLAEPADDPHAVSATAPTAATTSLDRRDTNMRLRPRAQSGK
jgi:hypothetical protein